jgi:hypothetical protein
VKLRNIICIIILFLPLNGIFAEVTVESTLNWSTGEFGITASRTLDPGMSPSDHPQALTALERELLPYILEELGRLAWDRQGTLKDQWERDPSVRTSVENLAASLNREWSRLSDDRKSVEASYTVQLGTVLPEIFPSNSLAGYSEKPIGWVPVPDDAWTGIVIYAPPELPVRGTGLNSNPRPALYARILSSDLEILADPGAGGGRLLSYQSIADRALAEPLTGRRPYQVMARELYGEYPCDIILSEDDTRRILAADSSRQALSDGRIVILLDDVSE